MEKVILTVATTGSGTPLSKYPNLPCSPRAIADEVCACYQAGAACAHIHVREDDGSRSMNIERFRETLDRIRSRCDILLNVTTSGLEFTNEERLAPLSLRPNMASFNAGSMNFGERVFANSKAFLEELAVEMAKYQVKPEIEVYDGAMIANAISLLNRGFLKAPLHFQLVLGVDGGLPATEKNLIHLVDMLPQRSTWSVVGVGRFSPMVWSMAMHMGGHIRFGTEDNIYLRKGISAQRSLDFLEPLKRLADFYERPLATVQDTKKILGLV